MFRKLKPKCLASFLFSGLALAVFPSLFAEIHVREPMLLIIFLRYYVTIRFRRPCSKAVYIFCSHPYLSLRQKPKTAQ